MNSGAVFGETPVAEWVRASDLDERQNIMVIGNPQSHQLSRFIGSRVAAAVHAKESFGFEHGGLLRVGRWRYGLRGIEAPFDASVVELFGLPNFFLCLKLLTRETESALQDLTEAFTTMDCVEMYSILRKTEAGPLRAEDLARVRAVPNIRPVAETEAIFREKGLPRELLAALLPLVRARCRARSDECPVDTWRLGFGYALVFSGRAFGTSGVMRLMPVAHIGPAGVVEAQGVLLERVKCFAPDSELRRKGEELETLTEKLEAIFGTHPRAAGADENGLKNVRQRLPRAGGRSFEDSNRD